MQLDETDIYPAMDPRLQYAADRRDSGFTTVATASSDASEIGVIALVTSVTSFAERTDVRVGAEIGPTDGGTIVTARVPLSRLEQIRQADGVVSLKAVQPLRPLLTATLAELEATPAALPPNSLAAGGAGVVVGFVDSGLDMAHQNFVDANGRTRIEAIWDQSGPTTAASPFGFGRRHGQADIQTALTRSDPYTALGYGPAPDSPVRRGSHGTHVADIAAGSGGGSGQPGVAPASTILFVDPAVADITWIGPATVFSSFGDSGQLLEAIRFLFDEAGQRPCVVNISLGTNGGPHDGSSLVERGIDAILAQRPNRAVVIAASNSFDDGIHAAGRVPAGGSDDVSWRIPAGVVGQSELEIWYPGDDRLLAEIIGPDGTSLGSVPLGSNARLMDDDGNTVLFIGHRGPDPLNGDNTIGVFLEQRMPPGTWTIRLRADQVGTDGCAYHAWIERNDLSQTSFVAPHDSSHTLGSISCGRSSIVVGSYDAHRASTPLSFFSSAGPTRDGREKPEVSAPGHDVLAAHSRTRTGVVRKSGTSMAAPAVAGIVALALAEARALGKVLDADTVRQVVMDTARNNPPAAGGWDPRYGHGRATAADAVRAVQKLV
ncbi:S8 family serine peptidase [Pseudonocardia cypriaca]|nr:S8 family serine peptidase [Pseudonocardia cypriaca]